MAEQVTLLVIYPQTADEAWEVLGDDAVHFGDNGGDPDGPSYYRPVDWFDSVAVDTIKTSRLGHVEEGWHEDGYTGSDAERRRMNDHAPFRWCGYFSSGDIYYISESPAPARLTSPKRRAPA